MNDILIKFSNYTSLVGYTVSFVLAIKLTRISGLFSFRYLAIGIGLLAFNSGFWLTLRSLPEAFFSGYWWKVQGAVSSAMLVIHILGVIFITVGFFRLYKEITSKQKQAEQVAASDPSPSATSQPD